MCPLDQRTLYKHLQASLFLVIAMSMDIHPNPGPTAIQILKEFTSPEQCLLFNKVKQLQLKITCYEQHKNTYTYYYKHKIIPKGLVIKCRPNVEGAFYEQWKGLLMAKSQKMIILLKQECQKNLKLLRSEFNHTLDHSALHLRLSKSNSFLEILPVNFPRDLHSRHRKKLSPSTGECVCLAFICKCHNNSNQLDRSNQPDILVNSSHSPITTSTNHVNNQSINHTTTTVNHPTPICNQNVTYQPVINAPDQSTLICNRLCRRKRKTKTNRY